MFSASLPPFRVGTTSYIIPAGLVDNARRLAAHPLITDMELVLFDLTADGGPCNLPDTAVAADLAAVGRESGLTYTVHLPLDIRHDDPTALDLARRTIDATRALQPAAYVCHLNGRAERHPSTPPAELARWQHHTARAVRRLAHHIGRADRLAVENVEGYPLSFLDFITARLPVRRCIDIGHLWVDGHPSHPYLRRYLPHTSVIHLHGLHHGRDHQSLAHLPAVQLDPVVDHLLAARFDGIVTLELFEDDFDSSVDALCASIRRYFARCLAPPAHTE